MVGLLDEDRVDEFVDEVIETLSSVSISEVGVDVEVQELVEGYHGDYKPYILASVFIDEVQELEDCEELEYNLIINELNNELAGNERLIIYLETRNLTIKVAENKEGTLCLIATREA